MVHRYWPVSEIYRTGGQTGTAFGTVLTSLLPRPFCTASISRKNQSTVAATVLYSANTLDQGSQYRIGGCIGLASGTIYFWYRYTVSSLPLFFIFINIYIYIYIYIYVCVCVCVCIIINIKSSPLNISSIQN